MTVSRRGFLASLSAAVGGTFIDVSRQSLGPARLPVLEPNIEFIIDSNHFRYAYLTRRPYGWVPRDAELPLYAGAHGRRWGRGRSRAAARRRRLRGF